MMRPYNFETNIPFKIFTQNCLVMDKQDFFEFFWWKRPEKPCFLINLKMIKNVFFSWYFHLPLITEWNIYSSKIFHKWLFLRHLLYSLIKKVKSNLSIVFFCYMEEANFLRIFLSFNLSILKIVKGIYNFISKANCKISVAKFYIWKAPASESIALCL